ncbi:hypothetical protein HAX54_032480 [Datura stramonium]|uniref:Protein kinase domain-containing protein n=1 Tax=Datura stramonium TaxID=4076 RepID=A0ABS8VB74_DATST|nr:hypothetical protein [Datura stramonium]
MGNPGLCLSGTEGSHCSKHVKGSHVKWKIMAGAFGGGALSMAIIIATMYLQEEASMELFYEMESVKSRKALGCQEEFIPGGTLRDVLHQRKPPMILDWESRHHIALGIAQGLSYLHQDSVPQIIHRDLKSNNVLDSAMEPKSFRPHSLKILFIFLGFEAVFRRPLNNCSLGFSPPHTVNGKAFPNLCRLPRLVSIDLTGNHFTGGIPTNTNCSQLDKIILNDNRFSGSIPPEIFKSSKLLKLDLSNNQLNGTIPSEVIVTTLLHSMHHLPILRVISPKRSLQELALSTNKFNGSISEKIGGCHQINYIDLSVNKLSGQIPRSVGRLKNLNNLLLHNNMLSGSLPAEFGNCTSLVEISLVSNFISGEIPSELCNLQNLATVKAFNNQIQGPIPECIGRMSGVEELGLYQNQLTGKIPPGITNMTKLAFLSLAHNNLTGGTTNLGKSNLPGLVKVDLGYNNFIGQIPSGLCNGNRLGVLVLENNRFSGSFPTYLAKCKSLYRVKLPNNNLQGSIPGDIEKNENISYLNVRGNMLAGRIPAAFAYWTSFQLEKVELLYQNWRSWISAATIFQEEFERNCIILILTKLLLQDNKLSGALPDTFSSSQKLVKLQLGDNMLEGPIPCSLSKLRQPNFALNLSMNNFSGHIPRCLSNLDNLEILDISSNNLSGAIPSEMDKMSPFHFSTYHLITCQEDTYFMGKTITRSHPDLPREIQDSAYQAWKLWAVKKVDLALRAFNDEMRSLKSVRHRNLVRLGGYCMRHGYGFILTEFISGGTLHDVLHQRKPPVVLDWESRHRIALGIAQGLSYLHHDSVPQIIHRDLKSDNVMLDSEMEPRWRPGLLK